MSDKDALVQMLHAAFASVQHPGNEALLRSDGSDDFDVRFLYPYEGKTWSEVPDQVFEGNQACLSGLSDAGLLFVLPIYLRKMIGGDEEDISNWSDPLLEILASGGRGNLKLSRDQYQAVDLLFFQFIRNYLSENPWKLPGSHWKDRDLALLAEARRRLEPR